MNNKSEFIRRLLLVLLYFVSIFVLAIDGFYQLSALDIQMSDLKQVTLTYHSYIDSKKTYDYFNFNDDIQGRIIKHVDFDFEVMNEFIDKEIIVYYLEENIDVNVLEIYALEYDNEFILSLEDTHEGKKKTAIMMLTISGVFTIGLAIYLFFGKKISNLIDKKMDDRIYKEERNKLNEIDFESREIMDLYNMIKNNVSYFNHQYHVNDFDLEDDRLFTVLLKYMFDILNEGELQLVTFGKEDEKYFFAFYKKGDLISEQFLYENEEGKYLYDVENSFWSYKDVREMTLEEKETLIKAIENYNLFVSNILIIDK